MPLNFFQAPHLIGGCEWYSMSRKPRSQGNIGCAGNWGKLKTSGEVKRAVAPATTTRESKQKILTTGKRLSDGNNVSSVVGAD